MIPIARLLTYLGTAGTVVGLSLVHARMNAYDYAGSFRFGFSIGLLAVVSIAAYALGLPDLVNTKRAALVAAMKATVAAALVVSVLQLFLGDKLLPRFVVLGSPVFLVPWLTLCSVIASWGSKAAAARARVFVVATEMNTKALAEDLEREPERPASIVGWIDPKELSEGEQGTRIPAQVTHSGATMLVLDRNAMLDEGVVSQAGALHETGLRIRTLVTFYQEWLGKLPISELERTSLMFDISELHRARYGRIKRVVDVIVGAIGLISLVALFPLVCAGNIASRNTKILYRQKRVGKNGREFWIYKFRTMPSHASEEITDWTTLEDPRISPFGRMLRRSHLDELPQMMNIIKGEMSLVGPRPEQPQYVRSLSETLPYYPLRYLVTPGLTGWAQVKFGYAGNDADALEKLQYDFFYLGNQGLRLDLLIVGRTLRNIVGLKGR